MPFKSKAQAAKFYELVRQGKMSRKTADEWSNATNYEKLPDRLTPKKEAKPK